MNHIPPIVGINRKIWRSISRKSREMLTKWLAEYGIEPNQLVAIRDCHGEAVVWYSKDGEIYRIVLDTTMRGED